MKLYTFTISHFAEKARWALDYKQARYDERRLLPGPHMSVTKRLASASTVPLLVDGERIVQGSTAIIDHADARFAESPLTPADPVDRASALELERRLDCDFGETLRRAFYADALDHPKLVVPLFTQGGPWWGPLFYRVCFGLVAGRIREMYGISAQTVPRDHDLLARELERIDALVSGRRYLFGDRFSRADLTLAALAAPMCDPPEHSTRWPSESLYPPRVAAIRAKFVGTPTHTYVMRMYRQHRRLAAPASL